MPANRVHNRVPTDWESQAVHLVQESLGIFAGGKENFFYILSVFFSSYVMIVTFLN